MLQIMETTEIPRVIWGASSSEMMSRVEKKLFAEKGFEAMAIIFARFATFLNLIRLMLESSREWIRCGICFQFA